MSTDNKGRLKLSSLASQKESQTARPKMQPIKLRKTGFILYCFGTDREIDEWTDATNRALNF